MSTSQVAALADKSTSGVNREAAVDPESPYARQYAEVLRGVNGSFAQFLRKLHGISGTIKLGLAVGPGSYSITAEAEAIQALQMLAYDDHYPRFKDNWGSALTYRYRPLKEATWERRDDTVKEVIQEAEDWIDALVDAMHNVVDVNNKPTSAELRMFTSSSLDKKAVESTCRSLLIALVHRCVVGFCGIRSTAIPTREDRNLTCKERLTAVINALKQDKRICKDIMTEDHKLAILVNSPFGVVKVKKTQEKGNDVKRNLLAEAAAARRKTLPSMTPMWDSQTVEPMTSCPEPVRGSGDPALQPLTPATSPPSGPAENSMVPSNMEALSSSSLAVPQAELRFQKRKFKAEDDEDIEYLWTKMAKRF